MKIHLPLFYLPTVNLLPLEKEMAVPSSIFAWRLPWTEGPARLQSVGSHRAGTLSD